MLEFKSWFYQNLISLFESEFSMVKLEQIIKILPSLLKYITINVLYFSSKISL